MTHDNYTITGKPRGRENPKARPECHYHRGRNTHPQFPCHLSDAINAALNNNIQNGNKLGKSFWEMRQPIVNRHFLARICQRISIVNTDDLRRYAAYSDCCDPEGRFSGELWRVRRVRTMTRDRPFWHSLQANESGFKTTIQRRECVNPDQEFIRASTCFNRLYIKSDRKLIMTVITCTPTMENT